ncbi:MAG TPA: DUF4365 domain-containing protein [Longimicrobium sp.]|nr:DUF4365 domain-containing protein [Longimicrobium sp.]
MPERSESHELEAEARLRLVQAFTRAGWTVEDLHQDYGEDLLVRIFKDRQATPLSFFIQSKGSRRIRTGGGPGGWASTRIRADHLRQWASFAIPVFVTLYDAESGVTYWENVEYFIEHGGGRGALRTRQKTVSFRIPLDNRLDRDGIRRIHNVTRDRFRRYQSERLASEALIDILEENTDLHVSELDVANETIILELPDGGAEFWFFGHTAEVYHAQAGLAGGSPDELVKRDLLEGHLPRPERSEDGRVRLVDGAGVEVAAFESEYAWKQAQRAESELYPIEDMAQGYTRLGEIARSVESLEEVLASLKRDPAKPDLEEFRKASELIRDIRERFASLPVLGARPDPRR